MNDNMVMIMIVLAVIALIFIMILIGILAVISIKEKNEKNKRKEDDELNKQVKKSSVIYTAEPIMDFMEFEKIEDNMIIQKNGKYLMVVECQGINYDLMSEMEKVAV